MNRRSRHVIAVTLVAAALCADRVAVAAPSLRTVKASGAAERLVSRLTRSFRRVIPATRVIVMRWHGAQVESHISAPEIAVVRPQVFSPFQFRLPPPRHA